MVILSEQTRASVAEQVLGQVRRNWGWLLALGILFIVLGTIGLGMTFYLTLASVLAFGVLLLIGGLMQLVEAFKCKGWKSVLWHVLMAGLYVLAGVVVVGDPVGASISLTALLGAVILAIGILRVLLAWHMRAAPGWGWPLAAGLASILLGALILARWPASGMWVLGLFVAIELIVQGWSQVAIALAARALPKPTAAATPA